MSDETPTAYVADACAMLAYLKGETGGDVFLQAVNEPGVVVYAHGAQPAEVFYDFLRATTEERTLAALSLLTDIGTKPREDMDADFWQDIGRLKAGPNPSLADCFGIALARRVDGTLLTTDHHELDATQAAGVCKVQFVR